MEFPTLENIDIVLASKVEKLAKTYNWLTGKDNFSLARLLNKAKFVVSMLFCIGATLMHQPTGLEYIPFLLVVVLYGIFIFIDSKRTSEIIRDVKGIKELEMELGSKSLGLAQKLRSRRFGFYFHVLIFSVLSYVGSVFELNTFTLATLFNVIIWHLIDLDEPPYKKSRLLEKIREAVTIPKLSPVPTH